MKIESGLLESQGSHRKGGCSTMIVREDGKKVPASQFVGDSLRPLAVAVIGQAFFDCHRPNDPLLRREAKRYLLSDMARDRWCELLETITPHQIRGLVEATTWRAYKKRCAVRQNSHKRDAQRDVLDFGSRHKG